MSVSQQTLGIVWAETRRLKPADGSDDTNARLQAVVGALAAKAESQGSIANFAAPAVLPAVGSPGGQLAARMATVVEGAIATGQQAGLALPNGAVLWETTATGEPREAKRPLPALAVWVKDGKATRATTFNLDGDATGRVFTLYESDVEPRAGEPSFVSGFTGSGVPATPVRGQTFILPWILGIVATVVFFWMLISLAWTGRSITQARDLMSGTMPTSSAVYLKKVEDGCNANGSAICQDAFPAGVTSQIDKAVAATGDCVKVPTQGGVSKLHSSAFCQFAWSLATAAANSGELTEFPLSVAPIVSALFGWPAHISERTGELSLAFPMAGLMISIALLSIALGLGTKGRAFGIWISPQNRISLARMQVTLWTIVVLGAYAAIAVFNSGMLAQPIRIAQSRGAKALLDTLTTFPSMPSMILAALGIAVASPMLSALIKGDVGTTSGDITVDLADDSQDKDKSGIGRFLDRVKGDGTGLEVRGTPSDASLADLFLGETDNNKDLVDVSRLQNVLITFILVFGYGTLLFEMVRDISPETIVGALNDTRSLFPALPDPGGIFTTLLAASHGTYLIAKASAK